jgi:hypothetical protein
MEQCSVSDLEARLQKAALGPGVVATVVVEIAK